MKYRFFLFFQMFNFYNIYCHKCCNCCCCKNNEKNNKNIENNNKYKKEEKVKDDNNDKKDKNIKDLNGVTESIFKSLATKQIFFSDEDRKKTDFKHFEFIKNMFPNGDNRCWLICEIIAFFNTPYIQEILLNNDFNDNKYLKSLKKLLVDCRSKNNKKQQLNCDEITKLIDDDINRNGNFEIPLYDYSKFKSNRKDRKFKSFEFRNFSAFTIKFKEDITNVINLDKIKNLDPILYSIKKSLNFETDIYFIGDDNTLMYNNIPFQEDKESRNTFEIMYIFKDENTEDKFFEKFLKFKNKKNYSNINEFYNFLENIFNEIKNNFKFECNSIIMHSFKYHFFSFCKNFKDNNWYNFNSLNGSYGEICNETVNELIKNKKITISGHEYIPDLFIISVSSK